MRVCIIIPMYNEEGIAKHSIETIISYAKKLPPIITVLAINDGSQDTTEEILRELISQYNRSEFQFLSHAKNQGYGAAQKTGISFAIRHNYDYVVFIDSDLTDHPRYLEHFYKKMAEGWEYIKTTRHSKGGGYVGVPRKRRIISKCGSVFARMVTGLPLTDLPNGFRAVKVDILKKLVLVENGFPIIVEEVIKARKITSSFCEIPRIQGIRSEEAVTSTFTYDMITVWKYFKYLFI